MAQMTKPDGAERPTAGLYESAQSAAPYENLPNPLNLRPNVLSVPSVLPFAFSRRAE